MRHLLIALALLVGPFAGGAAAQTITTVAGSGATGFSAGGFSGDGGLATSARLNAPSGVVADLSGNLFMADSGNHRIRKVAGVGASIRSTITRPADGSRLSRSSSGPVEFAWTAAAGASVYGFEHTGPNRRFANPNGNGPDSVNGFGGPGGGFVVSSTGFSTTLAPSVPPRTYQIRVIGLSPGGQVMGAFSDAVTVIAE